MTDNIVFICKYYKPSDKYNAKQEDKIRKREFLSCNGSYNYVSYVDTGSVTSVPKDYTEYVGNSEKSCGVFSAKGLLNDDEKRELREMLRNTQSCIWDCVISFREEFGDEYCRDYEQAYNFLKKELPKFFTRAGLDKDNIVWYAGLHENTENKHIHISFFEKEPQFMKNNKTLSYHSGKIPKDVLITSKLVFEKALTNKTAEIVKLRKDLKEEFNGSTNIFEMTRSLKRKFLKLYSQIPKTGRVSYDSENMEFLKNVVDKLTESIIYSSKEMKLKYIDYKTKISNLKNWQNKNYKHIPDKYNPDIYHKDLLRRLGNKTIQTALEIGKIKDRLDSITTHTKRDRFFKKKQRKRQLEYLFSCLDYYKQQEQYEMIEFQRFLEKLEAYRERNGYEM